MRWRWHPGSGPPVAATCSRRTSRTASTTASDGSWPGSSVCAPRQRRTVPPLSRPTPAKGGGVGRCLSAGRSGFGRRADAAGSPAGGGWDDERPWPEGVPKLEEEAAIALLPARAARPQGLVRKAPGHRRVARLRRRGAARLSGRRPSRRGPRDAGRPGDRSNPCSRRRSSRRRRWPCPRTTSRRSTRSPPWRGSSITSTTRWS